MSSLIQFVKKPFTSETTDAMVGSIVCYAGGILLLIIGVLKLVEMELNLTQLIFGLLLVCILVFQIILAGLMLEVYRAVKKQG
ncbi:MAG: hypothetical protein JXA52_05020 [Planctomycetes bacterium]|nr:hypothetical protein [Planctomycetota bacterium]